MKIAKFAAALAAAAVSIQAFAQEEETVEEAAPAPAASESVGYTAVALGLATPVQLPWGFNWDVFGLDFNVFYSDANKVYGVDLAFGGIQTREDLRGVALSALFNFNRTDVYGAEAALVNWTRGDVAGLAIDAVGYSKNVDGVTVDILGRYADGNYNGIAVAGIGTLVDKDLWGWQCALGANYAETVHGAQTSLIFNMTEELKGMQLGLVNFAAECPGGFQIGLVNIILDNVVPVFPILNFYLGF